MIRNLSILFALVISTSVLAQDSLNVHLKYHWSDSTLPPSQLWDNTYNEVWGYAANGREYAIIGSTMGTHIFDITDVSVASQVVFIPGAHQGPDIVHRDYHDYAGYLYMVSDEGTGGLQIGDLSYLPDSVPIVHQADTILARCHNIFIDSANAKLYSCGTWGGPMPWGSDLNIFDLSDPTSPVLLTAFDQYEYYHDIYVQNDTAIGNNATTGLSVYDFSNPTFPQILGSLTNYPEQGYNHSGWATPDMSTYFLADETNGTRIKALDISDLTDIQVHSVFGVSSDPAAVAHNLIYHDGVLYISYYHYGLMVYDVRDPANPILHGYYDTYPDSMYSFRGAWGVYPFLPSGKILVSDMQHGLFVFEVDSLSGTVGIDASYYDENDFILSQTAAHISLRNIKGKGQHIIQLRDIQGRTIQQSNHELHPGQTIELNITSDIRSGTYFISVQKDGYLWSKPVIITH